jgi:4-hydroxybenzoate polyprenyltransferase
MKNGRSLALGKLKALLVNIEFANTIFALPFAYMGAVLAVRGIPSLHDLTWITVAMVGARSAALALNRVIDLEIDKRNPRYTDRPMVTGAITVGEMIIFIMASFGLLFWAAWNLNPLCVKLLPLGVLPLMVYSYMKRISWTCHLVLGVALAAAPVGAWIAVTGAIGFPAILLGGAVMTWIAGFDILYGSLDINFDRANGLYSIPAHFGLEKGLYISIVLHVVSLILLLLVGLVCKLGVFYYIGVVLAAAILVYQHRIVTPEDLSKVNRKLFLNNSLVSTCIFLLTLIELLWRVNIP